MTRLLKLYNREGPAGLIAKPDTTVRGKVGGQWIGVQAATMTSRRPKILLEKRKPLIVGASEWAGYRSALQSGGVYMNAWNDWDDRDYVPPEPPQDERVRTYGIGRIVAVALSALAAVVLWDAGFDDVFANSTTWGQIGMIVSGGGLVVAFERFARLAELHFEAWQLKRRIDRLLEKTDNPYADDRSGTGA